MPAVDKGPPQGSKPAEKPRSSQPVRPRSRYASNPPDGRMPRIFLLAAAVVLVGAAIMFWPRGGGEIPTGIGERITVVTAEDSSVTTSRAVRSGDVEITREQAPVVPEKPRGGQPNPKPVAEEKPPPRSGANETKPGSASNRSAASTERPAPIQVTPSERGPWAVQVGAFGEEENAAALVTKLTGNGYPAKIRAASTSSGDIVYRVWIGFFATRSAAATYARQHRGDIGDGNPVHR